MDILAETLMPDKPDLPILPCDVSRADCRRALAQALRERADAVDACGVDVLPTFTTPSYYELVSQEWKQAERLADVIAMELYAMPLDQLPTHQIRECQYGAMYLLRRRFRAWRTHAAKEAERIIALGLETELPGICPDNRQGLAAAAREWAWTAFIGVLEDCGEVKPGDYLRIHAATLEESEAPR